MWQALVATPVVAHLPLTGQAKACPSFRERSAKVMIGRSSSFPESVPLIGEFAGTLWPAARHLAAIWASTV
jgi:hypothetical protein